jgi:hypothetical protein
VNKEEVEFYMKIIPSAKILKKIAAYNEEMKKLEEQGVDTLFEFEYPKEFMKYQVAFPVYKKLLYEKNGQWYASRKIANELVKAREKRREVMEKISWLKEHAAMLLAVIEAAERRGEVDVPKYPKDLVKLDLPDFEYNNIQRFRREQGKAAPGAGRPKGAKTVNRNNIRSRDKMWERERDKQERIKERVQSGRQPYPEERAPARWPRRNKQREDERRRERAAEFDMEWEKELAEGGNRSMTEIMQEVRKRARR